jgi:hypothetical protein
MIPAASENKVLTSTSGSIHCGIHVMYLEVTSYNIDAKTSDAWTWCIISTFICGQGNMFQ